MKQKNLRPSESTSCPVSRTKLPRILQHTGSCSVVLLSECRSMLNCYVYLIYNMPGNVNFIFNLQITDKGLKPDVSHNTGKNSWDLHHFLPNCISTFWFNPRLDKLKDWACEMYLTYLFFFNEQRWKIKVRLSISREQICRDIWSMFRFKICIKGEFWSKFIITSNFE